MKNLINRLAEAALKHARFIATRNEIARLPADIALDLGLYRGDAEAIARKAIYG